MPHTINIPPPHHAARTPRGTHLADTSAILAIASIGLGITVIIPATAIITGLLALARAAPNSDRAITGILLAVTAGSMWFAILTGLIYANNHTAT